MKLVNRIFYTGKSQFELGTSNVFSAGSRQFCIEEHILTRRLLNFSIFYRFLSYSFCDFNISIKKPNFSDKKARFYKFCDKIVAILFKPFSVSCLSTYCKISVTGFKTLFKPPVAITAIFSFLTPVFANRSSFI